MLVKNPNDPATPAQVDWIKALLIRKQVEAKWSALANAKLATGLTKGEASRMIEWFDAQPTVPKAAMPNLPKGVYQDSQGNVYCVRLSKTSGKTYAMKWRGKSYEYAPTYYRALLDNSPMPLPLDRAATLGIDSGFCVICGLPLSDPKSVAQGIGPVCVKKQSALINNNVGGTP